MDNQKLDVVIIADFCGNFDGKGNIRFLYIADLLIKQGHDVEIVTSDFSHGFKKTFDPIVTEYDSIKVNMLHESPYRKNVSVKRFLSHYGWGRRVAKYLKNRKKPDVIYCAMPTLKAAKEAGKYCEKNGVKFVIDVQDLWPEAYKMVFNIPVLSSLIFAPFNWIANSAYSKADEIIAVSQTYVDRAMKANNKVKEGHAVFLGTDLAQFDKNVAEAKLIQKKDGEIWLGYCGALGASYDLKIVFDAMRLLDGPHLRFIVIGDGPQRKEFEDFAKGLNVMFTGRLSYKDTCGILSECDIVVNPIICNSVQADSNNSVCYATIGKPVISIGECSNYQLPLDKYGMGYNITDVKTSDIAEKLANLISNPNMRIEMANNSRKFAQEELPQISRGLGVIDLSDARDGLLITLSNGQSYYKPHNEFWVGYCGSLSDSYDIKLVIDAIKKANNPKIRFVCMGDGHLRKEFESYGENAGINQLFAGRLDYSAMCQLLSSVDIVVNPIRGQSAASIINKHADYAASGKLVINTQQSSEYIQLLNEFEFGYSFSANQIEEISELLTRLSNDRAECLRRGANGRKCAEHFFDRPQTYKIILNVL